MHLLLSPSFFSLHICLGWSTLSSILWCVCQRFVERLPIPFVEPSNTEGAERRGASQLSSSRRAAAILEVVSLSKSFRKTFATYLISTEIQHRKFNHERFSNQEHFKQKTRYSKNNDCDAACLGNRSFSRLDSDFPNPP